MGAQHLHRALAGVAIRIDLVHEVRVEAEDLAVRGNEVARIVVLERGHLVGANLDLGQRVDGQRLEGAVGLADLGVLLTIGTALDVDLAGGQRGGRTVPARQRHVVARRGQHVAGRIEDVDILHATVGDATILQQVTAQDHHPAVLQQDLRGTEQEGLGGVEQQHVGRIVRAQLGIPHVVAELAVLPDVVVRTVGEHPTVGRDGGMDGNHRPVHFGQPFTPGLACLLFGRRGGRDRLDRLGRRDRGNRRNGRLGNFRRGLRRRLNHRRHGAHGSNRRSGGTGTRGAVGSRRGRRGAGSRTSCSGIGRGLVGRRRGGIGRGVAARLRGGIRRGDGVASTALGTRAGSGGARGGRTGITAATAACSQYGQHGKRGKLEGRRRDSHGDQSKRVKDVRRRIRDDPGKRWTPCRGHAWGYGCCGAACTDTAHRRLSASSPSAGFFTLENFTFASIWQVTISSWCAMGVPGAGRDLTCSTKKGQRPATGSWPSGSPGMTGAPKEERDQCAIRQPPWADLQPWQAQRPWLPG